MIPRLIPYVRGLSLAAALALAATTKLSAQVFVGSDNFASDTRGSHPQWTFAYRLTGTNGSLDFTNGRLDYSTAANGAGNFYREWDGDGLGALNRTSASDLNSWQADLTVTNTLSLSSSDFATIGFQIVGSGGNYSAIMLA